MHNLYWYYLLFKRPNVIKHYKLFSSLLSASYDEIVTFRDNQLIKLLKHAYSTTKYYREVLSTAGIVSEEDTTLIVNLDNFENIPLLTKEIIRAHSRDLISNTPMKYKTNTSGGTTGEPVKFLQNQEYYDNREASLLANYNELGIKPGTSIYKIWGSERDIIAGSRSFKDKVISRIKGEFFLNAFRMNESTMQNFINEQNKHKFKYFVAYVQSIVAIAKYLEEHKIKVASPELIITSAGVLYPEMKETLERVFSCKVINQYGSREIGPIAFSPPDTNILKISMNQIKLEISNFTGKCLPDNKRGNVIVTSLFNYKMPLIRYKIGDIGSMEHRHVFSNGTERDGLTSITGREVDIFTNTAGEFIDGEYFTHLFYHRNWVKSFQVIQKTKAEIQILVALSNPTQEIPQNEKKEIIMLIQKVMGKNCDVNFNIVKEILPDSSGKFRYTKSEVKR